MNGDGDDIFSDEDERRLPDSVFTIHGFPIPIYLHPSLSRGGSMAIARKIKNAGGNPYATEEEAMVTICRYHTPIFTELEFIYDHERYKWVEPPSWVDTCIELGRYEHYQPGKTDKAEKRHDSRTPFSLEDDENLVQFLAHRIPYKDSGGRLGNGVYKDLCDNRRASLYPWAKRHSWQSWRDRYSKNQEIYDLRINHEVKRNPNPPEPGGKGQYVIPRKARKPQPLRYNVDMEAESDDDGFEEEEGQEEQLRQAEQRRKERREEEEEEVENDRAVDATRATAMKRSRQESDLQDGRTEGSRQSALPPQKQPRIHVIRSNSEDVFVGIGQDQGKGKGHQILSESEFERPDVELNDLSYPTIYDDNVPGPSQRYQEPHEVDIDATMTSSKVNASNRQETEAMASPLLNVNGVRASAPPATPPKMLPDTQVTLVAPTQRRSERNTVPLNTQATIVPSSSSHNSIHQQRVATRGAASRELPRQRSVAYTWSRRPPGDDFIRLGDRKSVSGEKRPKGRPKRAPTQLPYVSLQQPQQRSTSAANASLREEVQVEEILQVVEEKNSPEPLEGDRDGSESLSTEDDEAARMLRNANKQMIKEGILSRSQPRATPNLRVMPYIDILRETARSSRKSTVLRRTSTNTPRSDPDATPKPKSVNARKAAKKTAAREPSSELHNSDSDLQSGITDTTGSSFPVETTNAREFLNAQGQYTPAPGTKAKEHILSKKLKSRQWGRKKRI